MDHMKILGAEVIGHAKAKAGDDLVRQVASAIPGVSGYL
jgi:prevent-host-death family protein